ncbi:Transposase family tnp2 [Ceratobasidium sp. AG-Ba]|nr:Transposase family tnp2 [Ceratobasidium sp. AG-Ba]
MVYCRCCGGLFNNPHQLRRHQLERGRRFAAQLAAEDAAENPNLEAANPALDNNNPIHGAIPVDNNIPGGPPLGEGLPNNNPAPLAAEEDGPGIPNPNNDWWDIDLGALVAQEMDEDYDEPEPMLRPEVEDDNDLYHPPPYIQLRPGALRNPPVMIRQWDVAGQPDFSPPESVVDDASIASNEQEPDFVEYDGPMGQNADEEPDMDDADLLDFLQGIMGDLAEEEWIDIFEREVSETDRKTLKFLAARLRTHLPREVYDDIRLNVCDDLKLPSDFVAWRRLKVLARGLESHAYDSCVNSCCCFLGQYRDDQQCRFCNEARFNANGQPRRVFHYTPLIPQLIGLFQSADSIKNMRHRVKLEAWRAEHPGVFEDVFDGEVYCTLRRTRLRADDPYRYFDSPDDIALGLGTDGFNMFKRRHKGSSTAWPLILVNYNLHPSIRTKLENIICVGVIPGPKECKDINSFLVPLIEELEQLAQGVSAPKVASEVDDFEGDGAEFILRAFLIILFGDIPAISKLLLLKGQNAISPCRTCTHSGTPYRLQRAELQDKIIYYIPLTAPDDDGPTLPEDLIYRTHRTFLRSYNTIEAAARVGAREELRKQCGLHGRPVFARLGSIDLSSCAPYEIMHLIFENLVPNMVNHWKGTFKWVSQADDPYALDGNVWKIIGELTQEATRTIPSQFVGTLPNIDIDMGLYKAEAFAFWFTYLGPILLSGRLPRAYYRHYLSMREIIIWCLQFEISNEEIDDLERMINQWVIDYERLYYGNDHDRLPACVLTIHALLHIPYYIRKTGPLSITWSFVVERFCGYLLRPALANRVRVYEYLDNFIRRRAQMQIVSRSLNMPELITRPSPLTLEHDELISTKEVIYDFLREYVLGFPVNKTYRADMQLKRQITRYFGPVEGWPNVTFRELHDRLAWDTLVRYGRFRMASGGDKVRVAGLIKEDSVVRDNSFIRYELLPDANPRRGRMQYRAQRWIHYGQVLDVFYLEWIENLETDARKPYLLARVTECVTNGRDASLPQNPIVTYNQMKSPDIINLGTVHAAVGRTKVPGGQRTYAIVDRSRGARTQFLDNQGFPDAALE